MADINIDGKLDMIIGGPTGPVVWYAYPDWTPTIIATSGSYNSACGIAVADIDNDGDQDVIMGGIKWYENPLPISDPSNQNWRGHTVGNHRSHDIVVSDLDDDGLIDIISRNQGGEGNVLHIYKQNSPDSWSLRRVSAVAGEGLTIGDYDNDGDIDIAIPKMWYENTGSILSGGWTARSIAPSFDQVAVAKSSDINHDGMIDIILSPSEAVGRVRWFECPQDPKTQPWNEHILGDQMNSIHGLGIADFDGDGDADIAASEFRGSQRLIIFKNDNYSGTKWSSQILGTQALHNIVVEDFDSDGDYDIFGSYCWNTPPAYLWINGSHDQQKYKFSLVPIYPLLLKK